MRCEIAWQEHDYMLCIAFLAPAGQLRGLALDADEFCEKREDVILGSSDQVPFWIGF